jgi:predicted Zn-dependent peptidase
MYKITNINGATFIFSPFKKRETASLGVFLGIGSRFEKDKLKGIAHYLEHMLFKGSKKYSYRRIKREVEGRGGALNAFTSQELTGYYAHFLNKNLKSTLDILLDMVLAPLFIEDEIEKERNVILEEIKMYNDLPSSRVVVLLDKLLWRGHPLGDDVIGYAPTVEKIKRSDLLDFKNRFYHPSNMVISCAADFDERQIIKLLEKKIKKSSRKISLKRNPPFPLRGPRIKLESRKLQQVHLCLGVRSVSYLSEQRFIADLLNVLLGANMSSRLFEEVREKKALCYDISTEVRKYKDSGAFLVHTGLDKSKVTVALKSILGELKKIKDKEVPAKELCRAKDYLLGQSAMGLERPQGRMFFFAQSYLALGKIYTLDEIKKKIESITPLQVKEFAGKIFKFNNMCVSCVGDFKQGEEDKIKKIITNIEG